MSYQKNYLKLLKSHKAKICVWGCGYIGYSTMSFYAKNNILSLGYDVDKNKVDAINKGKINIYGLKNWLGFKLNKKQKKNISSTTNIKEIINDINILCHFICIPTEKDGKPFFKYLREVIKSILSRKNNKFNLRECIIIESTLTPNTVDNEIKKIFKIKNKKLDNFHIAVAPRRDWFEDETKTLETLDRIFGTVNPKSNFIVRDILSQVSKTIHIATSYREAELVKSIENCYRHVEINLANELSLAYPDKNIREVLKLAGTKWNMNTYYPGFGTGGYCIPLSSKYVKSGSKFPKKLKIVNEAIQLDKKINFIIGKSIKNHKVKKVLVLGLSYKSNLKVHILSPTIELINYLKKNRISVTLIDPLYSDDEIKKIINVKTLNNINNFKNYDALIVMIKHNAFKRIKPKKIISNSKIRLILDNACLFNRKNFSKNKKITYIQTGESNWLK